ncbi:hypothetical protein EDD27_2135 [Nonomuraea polychroma]|uniref:Uncharacterized protein n=1 Tax=Nonomuraea polychroma TaxID=46176 RepID=A0A438M1Y3_9ACTN|nr:hypothetical protein [Nonomuraea polychroma]RVX39762.1 hypothetical protein EDD27_2135 [Nonomuraea polychroma]
MTIAESPATTLTPDVASLLEEFRGTFVPVAADFLEGRISANELRRRWKPFYTGTFREYDRTVERVWRDSTGTDGTLETGSPLADPVHELPLKHFPVSVAQNNLDRLIEVLATELGDRTVKDTERLERKIDFAHVVDSLDELMQSLAK